MQSDLLGREFSLSDNCQSRVYETRSEGKVEEGEDFYQSIEVEGNLETKWFIQFHGQVCAALAEEGVFNTVVGVRLFRLRTSSGLHPRWICTYLEVTPENDNGSDNVRAATSMLSTEIVPSQHIFLSST